jgi:hypothetical protein
VPPRTVEKWRFSEVDYSSAFNNFGGFLNAPNYPNSSTFAALKADGSIKAWGNSSFGGTGAPSDNGYTPVPPSSESPHAAIDPSALRAAKALQVE